MKDINWQLPTRTDVEFKVCEKYPVKRSHLANTAINGSRYLKAEEKNLLQNLYWSQLRNSSAIANHLETQRNSESCVVKT